SFYLFDLQYQHPSVEGNDSIAAYLSILRLINCVSSLSLFQSEEIVRTSYLMQDKSAVALPLIYNKDLINTPHPNLDNIKSFVIDIDGHSERKKIYIKELIDFLNLEKDENQRFAYLYR